MSKIKTLTIISVLLFIALVIAGYLAGNFYLKNANITQEFNKKINTEKISHRYALINNNCSLEQCLFETDYDLLGAVEISGYYGQRKASAWEQTKVCDLLVIKDEQSAFYKHYMDLVNKGNEVNGKDDNNNLFFSLDLSKLTNTERDKILKSTKDLPVKLLVFINMPRETEAPVCYSNVEILKVL